jgi:hypothetical protein
MTTSAIQLLKDLEWTGKRQGQPFHHELNDGRWFKSCPCCRGIMPVVDVERDWRPEGIGHKKDCRLMLLITTPTKEKS